MPLLKKVKVLTLDKKYGNGEMGLVAEEPIKAGELILTLDPERSLFYDPDDPERRGQYTGTQLLELMKKLPHARCYIRMFSMMRETDLYDVPKYLDTLEVPEEAAHYNHSCDPNSYYDCTVHGMRAVRDIAIEEELTVHYGTYATDDCVIFPFEYCQCRSSNCAGNLKFDFYRDPEWQKKYYDQCSQYIKDRIDAQRLNNSTIV
jgi:hypothetical protein